MAELKQLTYDERKAAEAAFTGAPPHPEWTDAARQLYVRLSAAVQLRNGQTTATAGARRDLAGTRP